MNTDLEREVDVATIWARRFLGLEAQVAAAKQETAALRQWLSATEKFVLENKTIGEHRTVREAVKAFYSEKGYGLPHVW